MDEQEVDFVVITVFGTSIAWDASVDTRTLCYGGDPYQDTSELTALIDRLRDRFVSAEFEVIFGDD